MFSYPKHLIQQAMSLPGVPSKAEIIRTFHTGEAIKLDHSLFDKEKYFAILTQAQAWAQQHLLTKSVGHRVATAIPAIKSWSSGNMPRVLVHSREVDGPQDYMRDLVVIGLVESGNSLWSLSPLPHGQFYGGTVEAFYLAEHCEIGEALWRVIYEKVMRALHVSVHCAS